MSRGYSCLIGKPVGWAFFLRTSNIKFSQSWLLAQSFSLDQKFLMISVCALVCWRWLQDNDELDSGHSGAELWEWF